MNFNPTIESRTDKELLEITSNKDDWSNKAITAARKELQKRGFVVSQINHHKEATSKKNRKVSDIKKYRSLTFREVILLVAFAPYTILAFLVGFLPTIGKSLMELENEGFHKLKWQRLIVLSIANAIWLLILLIFLDQ